MSYEFECENIEILKYVQLFSFSSFICLKKNNNKSKFGMLKQLKNYKLVTCREASLKSSEIRGSFG